MTMKNEKWVIGLVRYESSQTWYSDLNAELREVQFVIDGYEYRDYANAQRVISRWRGAGVVGGPNGPTKLPAPPYSREKGPNGRYQFYNWEPVSVDEHGLPGIQDGNGRAYQRVEYPYLNEGSHRDKFLRYRKRWENDEALYAIFVQKGQHKGRLALKVEPEREFGDETYRDALLLYMEDGAYTTHNATLWKGKDY